MTPKRNDPSVFLAAGDIHPSDQRHGVRIFGESRTGKSLLAKVLASENARCLREYPELDMKFAAWDPKRDMDTLISCFPPDFPFFDVDFVSRGKDWYDLFGGVESIPQIREIWEALLPTDPNEHQKYFPDKARQIAAAVHTVFFLRVFRPFTLRDIVLALGDERKLRLVLESHPYGKKFLLDLNKSDGALAVMSHMSLTAGILEVFAAYIHHQRGGRRLSASTFMDLRRGGILLPYHDDLLATVQPLITLSTKQLMTELLVRNDKSGALTILMIDEASLLKKLNLDLWAIKGAEGGGGLILAVQSPGHCEHMFGQGAWRSLIDRQKWTVALHQASEYDSKIIAGYLMTPVHWGPQSSEFRPLQFLKDGAFGGEEP